MSRRVKSGSQSAQEGLARLVTLLLAILLTACALAGFSFGVCEGDTGRIWGMNPALALVVSAGDP